MPDELPPYARLLGIERRRANGESLYSMPFSDAVLGRPGFLHGGAIAGLLEFAAIGAIFDSLEDHDQVTVKPINITVSYLRGGEAKETFASATVNRMGKRIANVEAHAWQDARDKPIATALMNVRLRRGEVATAKDSI